MQVVYLWNYIKVIKEVGFVVQDAAFGLVIDFEVRFGEADSTKENFVSVINQRKSSNVSEVPNCIKVKVHIQSILVINVACKVY